MEQDCVTQSPARPMKNVTSWIIAIRRVPVCPPPVGEQPIVPRDFLVESGLKTEPNGAWTAKLWKAAEWDFLAA